MRRTDKDEEVYPIFALLSLLFIASGCAGTGAGTSAAVVDLYGNGFVTEPELIAFWEIRSFIPTAREDFIF